MCTRCAVSGARMKKNLTLGVEWQGLWRSSCTPVLRCAWVRHSCFLLCLEHRRAGVRISSRRRAFKVCESNVGETLYNLDCVVCG